MPELTGLADASHLSISSGTRLPLPPTRGYASRMKALLSLAAIALLAGCGSTAPNRVALVVSGTITKAGLPVSAVHRVTLYDDVIPAPSLASTFSTIDGSFEIRAEVDPTLCDDTFYLWAALDNEAGSVELTGCGEHQVAIDIDLIFERICRRCELEGS